MRARIQVLLCLVVHVVLAMDAAAQDCSVLRVAGSDDWLPVTYVNQEAGEPKGLAFDFATIIGEPLGISLDITASIPWKRALAYLEDGTIDMVAAIYWTTERAAKFVYTEPYFENEARVFVLKGQEFPFDQLDDLRGRTGGIPLGGSFGEVFDSFADEHQLTLEGVSSKEQRVMKLMAGRNDYFINDYLDVMLYLRMKGLQDKMVPLPHPVSTTGVYFALSRESACNELVPRIDALINELK